MAFDGTLIKVGAFATEVPTEYIEAKTYKASPDQRMEWSAERDATGVLHRETVDNAPPKIEFTTISNLTNAEVVSLMNIFESAFTDAKQRMLPVTFYDDATGTYKTWNCYMPDVEFTISNVDKVNRVITYEPIRFAFIGY